MEILLKEFEEQNDGLKVGDFEQEVLSASLARFVEALRRASAIVDVDQETKDERESNGINAKWLLNLCQSVPSELAAGQIARAVWDASNLKGEGQQQEALFAALGASEEAVLALFEIGPVLSQIRQNIDPSELGETETYGALSNFDDVIDVEELNRQRLRQEALDAAQVAAIAQAEASEASGSATFGSTHTVQRKSHLQAQKAAQKAKKKRMKRIPATRGRTCLRP